MAEVTANQLVQDPDFLGLPQQEQVKVLSRLDSSFAGLSPEEQGQVIQELRQSPPTESGKAEGSGATDWLTRPLAQGWATGPYDVTREAVGKVAEKLGMRGKDFPQVRALGEILRAVPESMEFVFSPLGALTAPIGGSEASVGTSQVAKAFQVLRKLAPYLWAAGMAPAAKRDYEKALEAPTAENIGRAIKSIAIAAAPAMHAASGSPTVARGMERARGFFEVPETPKVTVPKALPEAVGPKMLPGPTVPEPIFEGPLGKPPTERRTQALSPGTRQPRPPLTGPARPPKKSAPIPEASGRSIIPKGPEKPAPQAAAPIPEGPTPAPIQPLQRANQLALEKYGKSYAGLSEKQQKAITDAVAKEQGITVKIEKPKAKAAKGKPSTAAPPAPPPQAAAPIPEAVPPTQASEGPKPSATASAPPPETPKKASEFGRKPKAEAPKKKPETPFRTDIVSLLPGKRYTLKEGVEKDFGPKLFSGDQVTFKEKVGKKLVFDVTDERGRFGEVTIEATPAEVEKYLEPLEAGK